MVLFDYNHHLLETLRVEEDSHGGSHQMSLQNLSNNTLPFLWGHPTCYIRLVFQRISYNTQYILLTSIIEAYNIVYIS